MNHRDFFSVIFVRHPDLEHQPNEGVEGLRGEGRLQDLSLYVASPSSSVCLQVGQIILLLPSIPFSSVSPCGMRVVSALPLNL